MNSQASIVLILNIRFFFHLCVSYGARIEFHAHKHDLASCAAPLPSCHVRLYLPYLVLLYFNDIKNTNALVSISIVICYFLIIPMMIKAMILIALSFYDDNRFRRYLGPARDRICKCGPASFDTVHSCQTWRKAGF
jgi:hypothetical protein